MTKVVAVLGGANGVWQEYQTARELLGRDFDFIVATNHAGRDAEFYIDHWCSVHGDLLIKWYKDRKEKGGDVGKLWTAKGRWKTDKIFVHKFLYKGGSSGLLATDVAIHNGANKVILCGVGLTSLGSHYDDKIQKPWREASRYRPQWVKRKDDLNTIVKSMSGWTKDYFGKVTEEWLNDN